MKIDQSFTNSLDTVLSGMHNLMEMVSAGLSKEDSKTRGSREEFLVVLLDFLQVASFLYPPSTFALNRNASFLLMALPNTDSTIDLHWASVVGDEEETFESVMCSKLLPRCLERGFDLSHCSSVYYMVGTGEVYISLDFMIEVIDVTGGGFSVDEVVGLYKSHARGEPEKKKKTAYAGFLTDESLQDRLRVSVLALSPSMPEKPLLTLVKR